MIIESPRGVLGNEKTMISALKDLKNWWNDNGRQSFLPQLFGE